jgi:hypothetical protein
MPCKDYSDLSTTQLLEILRELKGMLRDHEKAPSPRPAALGPSRLGIGIYPDHDRDPTRPCAMPSRPAAMATVYTHPRSVEHSDVRNVLRKNP